MGGDPYVYKECVIEEARDLERLTVDVAVFAAMKPPERTSKRDRTSDAGE